MADQTEKTQADFPIGRVVIIRKPDDSKDGTRQIVLEHPKDPTWVRVTTHLNQYGSIGYKLNELELVPLTDIKKSGYNYEEHILPILWGKVVLPNWKPYPPEEIGKGVAAIAAGGGLVVAGDIEYCKLPKDPESTSAYEERGQWSRVWLCKTQGGHFDGTGYVMLYNSGKGMIGRFAICEHTKYETSSVAEQQRGWHPGSCTKCGLNMTVDSGD